MPPPNHLPKRKPPTRARGRRLSYSFICKDSANHVYHIALAPFKR